ncbi:MAG: DNA internalization-related competence protein ComEC/Rec2 [Candidatus Binataceae bacterium]
MAERSSQANAPDDRGVVALAFTRFDKVPPIYAVAIAICLGDGLANFRLFVPSWLAAAIVLTATVAFLTSRPRAGYLLALAAIAAAATLPVCALLEPPVAPQSIRALPDGTHLTVEGRLIDEPEHLPDLTHLTLGVLRAGVPGAPLAAATGVVRVAVLEQVNPRIGDEMSITSRIRFPRNNGNPGEYDYEGFMAREGISATMTVTAKEIDTPAYQVLAHHPEFPFSQLQDVRDRIAALIDGSLPAVEAGEMRALVIGDRSGIDSDLRDAFARSGMAHLLVISGLHLGFVAAVVFVAGRMLMMIVAPGLASRGWANKAGAIAASIAVCAYTAIAGHHVSTVRAMVMVLAYMMAIVLDRAREAIASLALAAIVICLVLPGSTADVGFELSFASVLAIILGMQRFAAWIKMRQRRGRLPGEPSARRWVLAERPLGYVAVSFWAALGTAPLTAFHFNQVALVGLIANAVVVPIMGFGATLAGLVGSVLGFIWTPAGRWVLELGAYALRLSNSLAGWFVDWPLAWAHAFTPTLLEMLLAYALIILWLTAGRARPESSPLPAAEPASASRWRIVAASALTLAILIDGGWWFYSRFLDSHLRVTFLSVGEGDAAVVRFPGHRVMLIDAGGAYGGYDYGERAIAPYLWSQKILHVDYLVLSHPDADHFGGFAYIAENFSPAEFWAPSIPSADESYAATLIAMAQAHVQLRTLDPPGIELTIANVMIHTLAANPPSNAKHNNGSAVLRLGFGKAAYLFTGDIEAPAENLLISEGADLRASILKVPHHGSGTSSTQQFIEAVRPAVAVISDGYLNRFHFPAPQVIDRYHDAGVALFRTDLDGAVMTEASPDEIRLRSFSGRRMSIDPR